jgi:hypothetical protein
MRRALQDFLLRGVIISVTATSLAYVATSGSNPVRTRVSAATPRPDLWTRGARSCVVSPPELRLDTDALRDLQVPLRKIRRAKAPLSLMEPIIAQDDRLLAPLIELLLSDDEEMARAAGETLRILFERRGIRGDRGGAAVSLDHFNEPEVRAGLHQTLGAWLHRNRRAVEAWGARRFERILDRNAL